MSTVSQNSIQGTSVSLKYSNFGVGTAIVIALLLIIINVCRESTSEQKEKDQELKKMIIKQLMSQFTMRNAKTIHYVKMNYITVKKR